MAYGYSFYKGINLHVKGRVSHEDAVRQMRTAQEILRRLGSQSGVILADEVGMGKTFVALAVAVSVHLQDPARRPVVVMVPPSLQEKWPRDFEVFRERCLPKDCRNLVSAAKTDSAVGFLKLVDDPAKRRKGILFVTHGAMSRGLTDRWVKLALIQKCLKGRHNTEDLRTALVRIMGSILRANTESTDLWRDLLEHDVKQWQEILKRQGANFNYGDGSVEDDDPVPSAITSALSKLRAADTNGIYEALQSIPRRNSESWEDRVKEARQAIQAELAGVWARCLSELKTEMSFPLLILDEAHHLKNSQTKLASIFQSQEAEADANQLGRGSLAQVFERMIFLTATPFQLGHGELCSVLDRFGGVRPTPGVSVSEEDKARAELRQSLDYAQRTAAVLDREWGKLRESDLTIDGLRYHSVDDWWSSVSGDPAKRQFTSTAQSVIERYQAATRAFREAEEKLKPWIIRHLKPRHLPAPHHGRVRRERVEGGGGESKGGILLAGDATLPFLLAAQASFRAPQSRPLFAEGLASSYEAFLNTRSGNSGGWITDSDDDESGVGELGANDVSGPRARTSTSGWHLDRLHQMVRGGDGRTCAKHPKVQWTIDQVLSLWREREKVVVFCHYLATGRALRRIISSRIHEEILQRAVERLGCSPGEAEERLERIGRRFFDADSPVRERLDEAVSGIVGGFKTLRDNETMSKQFRDVVRRNFRTPSFLVRYFPLDREDIDREAVSAAFDQPDGSGLTLRQVIVSFCEFLQSHCSEGDRQAYLQALNRIQVGSHVGAQARESYTEEELQDHDGETDRLMPNVRLVNGRTPTETRQRLMLTFNTPFYPEVLITSNVLAEGVDLHLYSRHVIHHDLCWNPSTLEQRTGRVDRIGSKAEKCGNPIQVMLPYIAETQDEKMYRVVMDRERWFQVVMGGEYTPDLRSMEKLAQRVPFPESAARDLGFQLAVGD